MFMKHVTIQCRDREASIRFYEDIAGLHVTARHGAGPVFLANAEGETCIELIENKERAYTGSGLSVGFHTEDVEAYREKLIALGYEATPITSPNPNTKFFFISDPDGVQIQFI